MPVLKKTRNTSLESSSSVPLMEKILNVGYCPASEHWNAGLGNISQGFIELSNVNVVEEMVSMIVSQRAYEINSKVVQTSDDMLQMANNLKR